MRGYFRVGKNNYLVPVEIYDNIFLDFLLKTWECGLGRCLQSKEAGDEGRREWSRPAGLLRGLESGLSVTQACQWGTQGHFCLRSLSAFAASWRCAYLQDDPQNSFLDLSRLLAVEALSWDAAVVLEEMFQNPLPCGAAAAPRA